MIKLIQYLTPTKEGLVKTYSFSVPTMSSPIQLGDRAQEEVKVLFNKANETIAINEQVNVNEEVIYINRTTNFALHQEVVECLSKFSTSVRDTEDIITRLEEQLLHNKRVLGASTYFERYS